MAFRHYGASGTGPTLLTLSSGSIYQGAEVVASQSHTIIGRSVVVSTDWQVSDSPSFSTVVWQSLGQVANPFTATVPASTLAIATAYYARWRANYADGSTSPWAPAIGFAASAVTLLTVNTIMVAGGGNGGSNVGGGGGGGEVYHASLSMVSGDTFVVGSVGGPGQNTVANGITVIAGGVGGSHSGSGANGGSGGGGGGDTDGSGAGGGSAVGSYLGNAGGNVSGINWRGGGGGGAGGPGSSNGNGGPGYIWIDGLDYGSGGGGGARNENGSPGAAGGAGAGAGVMGNGVYGPGQSATARGGGGGGGPNYGGSNGGSGAAGCVVLAYSGTTVKASGGAVTTDGVFTYHKFAGPGSFSVL